jgi:tRNA A22 N-methylase
MTDLKKTKRYKIIYQNVAPSGIVSPNLEKQELEATSQDHSIAILKTNVLQDSGGAIRIVRIEHLNEIKQKDKKTKRSLLGYFALGIFGAGMLAKLIGRLF